MQTIRVANLRSLADTGPVHLRPLTLLVGKNSSGKSTFLRCMPLIKQSVGTRSNSPLLWYGDFVDFGSFSEAKNNVSGAHSIIFELGFDALSLRSTNPFEARSYGVEISTVKSQIELVEVDGSTRLKSMQISADTDLLKIEVDPKGGIASIDINGLEQSQLLKRIPLRISSSVIIPQLFFVNPRDNRSNTFLSRRGFEVIEDEISRYLRPFGGNRMAELTLRRMIRKIR